METVMANVYHLTPKPRPHFPNRLRGDSASKDRRYSETLFIIILLFLKTDKTISHLLKTKPTASCQLSSLWQTVAKQRPVAVGVMTSFLTL